MRLLTLGENDQIRLTPDLGSDVPQYGILSHTWLSNPDEEVDYEDLINGTGASKEGYEKLYFAGQQARKDGLEYFWVDTCCIKRSSEPELSQAIRSMFRWYRDATKCYVYLTDVQNSMGNQPRRWESDFVESRWFKRGWTLQELLAPTSVEFYSRGGVKLGDKHSLEPQIYQATRIPLSALRGTMLSTFSIEDRLSWAEGRQTKREEDSVYSLLGIFDVHIPILYGEGKKNALKRLLRELRSELDSILGEARPGSSSTTSFQSDQDSLRRATLPMSTSQLSASGSETTLMATGRTVSEHDNEQSLRMWLGEVCTEVHTENYNHWRNYLSNAAKYGNWDRLWKAIDIGTKKYGESWVDAVRIKSRNEEEMSLWTPLHQAVFNEAPVEVVHRLLSLGAFRTLRTRWTEFSEHDMTPLELAYELNLSYLYDILTPTIRSPVPTTILSKLEAQFHTLIRADLGQRVDNDKIYLPLLHVLTELWMEAMWFPVKLGSFKAGYTFQLQGRDLMVKSFNIPVPVTHRTYRITKNEIKKIEEYFRYDEGG